MRVLECCCTFANFTLLLEYFFLKSLYFRFVIFGVVVSIELTAKSFNLWVQVINVAIQKFNLFVCLIQITGVIDLFLRQFIILLTNLHERIPQLFVLLTHLFHSLLQLPQFITGIKPQWIILFLQLHFLIHPDSFSLCVFILYFIQLFLHSFPFTFWLFSVLFVKFRLLL